MVPLGTRNSRMKDFHDVWFLAQTWEFSGKLLCIAIEGCFQWRSTPWTQELPEPLQLSFYSNDMFQDRWQAYLRSSSLLLTPPQNPEMVGESIRMFLGPVHESILVKVPFNMHWPAGGPWTAPLDGQSHL